MDVITKQGARSFRVKGLGVVGFRGFIVRPKKLEAGLRTNSAGFSFLLLLRIEAIGLPTLGVLLGCQGLP